MKLLKNKAQCRNCKDIIESKSRHDWVCCSCFTNEVDNKGIYIDGGIDDYIRQGGKLENIINLCEYSKESERKDNK